MNTNKTGRRRLFQLAWPPMVETLFAALIGTGRSIAQLRADGMLPTGHDGSSLPLDAPVAVKEAVLGVRAETLAQYGAVSEPVARQMAEGARQKLGADLALGVTGIAGPDADGSGKEVGMDERFFQANLPAYPEAGLLPPIHPRCACKILNFVVDLNFEPVLEIRLRLLNFDYHFYLPSAKLIFSVYITLEKCQYVLLFHGMYLRACFCCDPAINTQIKSSTYRPSDI